MTFKFWSCFSTPLEIFKTNYGRTAGWFVEKDGRCLALLSEPIDEDMFWVSYAIKPLSDDPVECEAVMNEEFWREQDLQFRNVKFNVYAKHAFPALNPFVEPGRVNMRALYLPIKPAWLEHIFHLCIAKAFLIMAFA